MVVNKAAAIIHHFRTLNSDAAYRQMGILDILRGLARLRTSVSTYFLGFVFEHEAPGSVLSHRSVICLLFERM